MEHTASSSTILLNVVIQILNIVLFFFLFIKLVGKPITNALVQRIEKEKKLAHAEEAYNIRIDEARKISDSIIQEAHIHKVTIERESEIIAKQKRDEILQEASRKADVIIDNANKQAKLLHAQMELKFTDAVKSSVHLIVDKLFENKDIHKTYVDWLVEEFSHSAQKKF